MKTILTISQLNKYIMFKFQEDSNLQNKLVQGEISDFSFHSQSGHMYFRLHDEESSIHAIMFSTAAKRLNFKPCNGMQVVVSASIKVYQRDGIYQLVCSDMLQSGKGSKLTQLQILTEQLAKEGLFSQSKKRLLPTLPRSIAVVTSSEGAALQDIIQILQRRYPLVTVKIFNVSVQGIYSPEQICSRFKQISSYSCDLVILARGGGSQEDLSAFQKETVVRAVAACPIPVISAIGHETDLLLVDLAADVRAPTPSAAAELAVPDIKNIIDSLQNYAKMLYNRIINIFILQDSRVRLLEFQLKNYTNYTMSYIHNQQNCMDNLHKRLKLSIQNAIYNLDYEITAQEKRLHNAILHKLDLEYAYIDHMSSSLRQLDPYDVLKRGYAVVYVNGQLIKTSTSLNIGDQMIVEFSKGNVSATVDSVQNKDID